MILLDATIYYILIPTLFGFMLAILWLLVEFRGMKEAIWQRLDLNNETARLKLQAYERLTMFAERAGLKNLVSRSVGNSYDESANAMHQRLIDEIKQEYEYNSSQQIYVGKEVWNAVTKLKDQNIYIINQLAATLPHHALAVDLSKTILEYSMTEKAELNKIVLDALQFEAKKIMK
jgi:hypothetical protein